MAIATTLTDGRQVFLRLATVQDTRELEQMFYRLTPQSVYSWLRVGAPQTPHFAQILANYAQVDGYDTVSVIAESQLGRHAHTTLPSIIGVARYVRISPTQAEIAVVIEDGWQGRHLGRVLLGQLASQAVRQHVLRLTGDCLADNRWAIRLIAAAFPQRTVHWRDGMCLFYIPLI